MDLLKPQELMFPISRRQRYDSDGRIPPSLTAATYAVAADGTVVTPDLPYAWVNFFIEAANFYHAHLMQQPTVTGQKGRLLVSLVFPTPPRTQKNSQMIGIKDRKGTCTKCGQIIGTRFIMQSAANKEQLKDIKKCGKTVFRQTPVLKLPLTRSLCVTAIYYMDARRLVDLNNLISATDDILKSIGVIADDKCSIVTRHDGSYVDYDKANPRTEVFIYEWVQAPT